MKKNTHAPVKYMGILYKILLRFPTKSGGCPMSVIKNKTIKENFEKENQISNEQCPLCSAKKRTLFLSGSFLQLITLFNNLHRFFWRKRSGCKFRLC